MGSGRIESAGLKHLDDLLNIEERCFSSDQLSRRQMQYILKQARAFSLLSKTGGETGAYCTCLTPAVPRPARLYSLAVLPEYRGKGLASALIKKALKNIEALGYSRCRLEVRLKDRRTQSLYKKFGFRVIEQLPAYYQDGADGVRMELVLPASRT